MGLPKPIYAVLRIVIDICVVVAIILLVPGVPPNVKFESYRITPPMELKGPLSPNTKLDKAEFLFDGELTGPESIVARNDELITGLIGGEVVRIKNGKVTVVAKFGRECEGKWQEEICGRPLGMRIDSKGKLIIADSYYGVYRVDLDSGTVANLVNPKVPIDGKSPATINDLDVAKDGTIYYTDSSSVSLQNTLIEFLGEPTGRLLKYDPSTKESTVLLKGLHFANGVQLSNTEDFVIVAETCQSRIMRYYLKGEKKGQSDIFVEGLPGLPDNIRPDGKGGILVSLPAIRTADFPSALDFLADKPWVRKFILRITTVLQSGTAFVDSIIPNQYTGKAKYYLNHLEPVIVLAQKKSMIVQLDQHGKVIRSIQGSKAHHISEIAIDEKREFAYLGSPYNQGIWKLKVQDLDLK